MLKYALFRKNASGACADPSFSKILSSPVLFSSEVVLPILIFDVIY